METTEKINFTREDLLSLRFHIRKKEVLSKIKDVTKDVASFSFLVKNRYFTHMPRVTFDGRPSIYKPLHLLVEINNQNKKISYWGQGYAPHSDDYLGYITKDGMTFKYTFSEDCNSRNLENFSFNPETEHRGLINTFTIHQQSGIFLSSDPTMNELRDFMEEFVLIVSLKTKNDMFMLRPIEFMEVNISRRSAFLKFYPFLI